MKPKRVSLVTVAPVGTYIDHIPDISHNHQQEFINISSNLTHHSVAWAATCRRCRLLFPALAAALPYVRFSFKNMLDLKHIIK